MRLSLSLFLLVNVLCSRATETECQSDQCQAENRVRSTCSLVYAPIPNTDNEAVEWGVFSLTDRSKGRPVWPYGDVVIQVPDASDDLKSMLQPYLWNAQETGGQYEGHNSVYSLVPGLGMMTRTVETGSNLIPLAPRYDEGGLTRFDSPGAGASTHYHNYTWFIRQPVQVGDELLMESSLRMEHSSQSHKSPAVKPSREYLLETGYCLDNIRPHKSKLKAAGRGAFATVSMPKGTVVAPVPLLPLSSSALQINSGGKRRKDIQREQLLRNYCFGNTNSTILLYPHGSMINLINHYPKYNVKLQWSKYSQSSLDEPLSLDSPPFLLMELVATRDIQEGEELFLDYGGAWEEAWFQHQQGWEPSDMHYTPSYVMDDAIQNLRTQQQQKEHEYPDNVFTSCFYKYSDRDESERALEQPVSAEAVTTFKWQFTKGLYDLKHLRPCEVLRRIEGSKGRSGYAVRMLNRPGLPEHEVIPQGSLHIVTHIPRHAIRFSDKAGTTDHYMPGAFRQFIGLNHDIFPTAWMDLKKDN